MGIYCIISTQKLDLRYKFKIHKRFIYTWYNRYSNADSYCLHQK